MNKIALAFSLTLFAGCAHPQLPFQFNAATAAGPPLLDQIVRLLATQGQQVAQVDPTAGVVYTRWQDTGFMYGQVQGATANIVRRYLVALTPREAGVQVMVRMEAQRCGQHLFSIVEGGLQGTCEEMTGIVEKHQHELETLGTQLQAGLRQGS